jgi:hypothetical protein
MIEKVRSIAIGLFFKEENAGEWIAAAYSERALARQATTTALVIERGLAAQAKRQREASPRSGGTKKVRLTQTCPRLFARSEDFGPRFLSRHH